MTEHIEKAEDCEDYRDCDLPTDERHTDGDMFVCPNCNRLWEYREGYFTQIGWSEKESQ